MADIEDDDDNNDDENDRCPNNIPATRPSTTEIDKIERNIHGETQT